MPYHPDKHHRRSIRLKGYDYSSAGAYFITLCTHQRNCLFGAIADGEMHLNELGQIVADEWLKTLKIRPDFDLDEWIVMPNHIHGIVVIATSNQNGVGAHGVKAHGMEAHGVGTHGVGAHGMEAHGVGAHSCAPLRVGVSYRRPRSLSSFVAGFKAATTKRINITRDVPGTPVWQRNYHDRIIRDERALQNIRHYIQRNPRAWGTD